MLRRHLLLMVPALSAGRTARAQRTFAPGQAWSIKTAESTSAKVVIGRVEALNGGTVVHVSIVDVPIPADLPKAGSTTTIGHMPFDQAALTASVDRLLGTGVAAAPDFESGYRHWQEAKGGVFTISVPQALEFAFNAVRQAPARR